MGYIKLQKTGAEFDLVSAENIGDVKLSTGDIVIQYLSGYKVTVSGTGNFTQEDTNIVENAIDVMNGASGVAPMTKLSQAVEVTMTVIS
jgi:hypothetical protein